VSGARDFPSIYFLEQVHYTNDLETPLNVGIFAATLHWRMYVVVTDKKCALACTDELPEAYE